MILIGIFFNFAQILHSRLMFDVTINNI